MNVYDDDHITTLRDYYYTLVNTEVNTNCTLIYYIILYNNNYINSRYITDKLSNLEFNIIMS